MEASDQPARRATVVSRLAPLGRAGWDTDVTTGINRAADHVRLSRRKIPQRPPMGEAL